MAIRLSGLMSGLDTDSIVQDLMKVQRLKTTGIEKNITKLQWTQDRWKELNTKLYSFYTGPLSKLKAQGSFKTMKATSSNSDKVEVTANTSAPEGNHKIQVSKVASAQFLTGKALEGVDNSTTLNSLGMSTGTINITVGGKSVEYFNVGEETKISDFVKHLKDSGLNASFDTVQQRFFISSKETGTNNKFTIEGNNLNVLGLDTTNGAKNIEANDAEVIYNGATLTSSSNTFSANGLTFTVKDITNEEINLSITKDTQAAYDTIKDFIKSYNELLQEMNGAYDADSARGYDPLTEDEKAAMTDKQVEQWEDKIKASLLRRDNTLNKVITTMRSTMGGRLGKDSDVNNAEEKYGDEIYSLSTFGIVTGTYNEKGLLHIEGDADSPSVAAKENKLMKALEENPEAVMNVMNDLANQLYDTMTTQMKSTTLSSALTFYNDKSMNETVKRHQTDLAKWESRLLDMEDRYYRQFTAMEKAMQQMNSQSASIASMLGMGQ